MKSADTGDLKSPASAYGFESRPAYTILNNNIMKKKLLKKSEVLHEGYVKGLKKA